MDYLKACIGFSPVYDLDLREIRSLVEASRRSPEPSQPLCIVFTLEDGSGTPIKLLRIISAFAKIGYTRIFLAKTRFFTTKTYGIYPTTEQPVVIFEMLSPAEGYVVDNILPEGPSGFNGYLRLIITRLTKINPVLGGVAFVIRENV